MTKEQIIMIVLGAVILVLALVVVVLARKNHQLKFGGIKIKNGVRYTTDEQPVVNGETKVTYNEKDIILQVGVDYTVGQNKFLPGTYTVLASNEQNTSFNIRVGGLVREYHHGDKIVVNAGDVVTAVSHIVILR